MARHNALGKWGEKVAVDYLVGQGYAIRDVNWRMPPFEVDIIAMNGARLVFVEVKTRSDNSFDPALAINRRKIWALVNSANAYVRLYNLPHEIQFDVIYVVGDPLIYNLEHIPDAFTAPLRTYR